MRLTTPRTLLAIAIGIATATGATAAFCGQGGPHGDHGGGPDKHLAQLTERLNLTPEQQAQVKTIIEKEHAAAQRLHADTRKQIEGVLTDAQRAEQSARMQKRLDRHLERMGKRLTLTPEQTTQIRAILVERQTNPDLDRTAVKERIAAVLTPEQKQQFESMGSRDEHRGNQDREPGRDGPRHGQRGGPDGDGPDGPDDGPDGGPDQGPNQR
ncbi:Spy/CpxP family protein refolding chaperone [uncultured Thiodictyon sp.]|uniref:Spy/CpxP family protein refolding chaperone n=1 Tax=uncultured Thiodictyon sp. TaxID=1846217 RepID=UPI0025E00932|nr:Spy/CpxP family protein refolding chaperone [uncultured Thiodictyon sp.]